MVEEGLNLGRRHLHVSKVHFLRGFGEHQDIGIALYFSQPARVARRTESLAAFGVSCRINDGHFGR